MTDPADFLSRLRDGRLIVVGDVMLDRYTAGAIDRISPEAPVPVLHHAETSEALGGAGNVAANLAALGAEARLFGRIGRDMPGERIAALCGAAGIPAAGLITADSLPTTTKTRFVSAGQQVLRVDDERAEPLGAAAAEALLAAVTDALAGTDALILSDYAKGLFAGDLAPRLIAAAREAGIPVIVDPKGTDYARYRGASAVSPNRGELALATGRAAGDTEDIVAAARDLIAAHDLGSLLVTRSEDGLSLITASEAVHVPAEAREVFDVSGAGDTVVAVFALGLALGLQPRHAAPLANTAAGIVVAKRGTAQLSARELREGLARRRTAPGALLGASTLEETQAAIAAWRAQGYRIGFTNGCFDILHYGHASILVRARALCDRLIVGLNSDASVARLKGEGRPVNPAADRAALLLALRAVDAVVVFEEDTPRALIGALQPDLLVKGADYTLDEVVGADIVLARGGEVKLLELEDGRSTSGILAKARADQ